METPQNFQTAILEVKIAKGKKHILASDIAYIEGSKKHSIVHFAAPEPSLETHCLLKWFTKNLPEEQYYRCHESFIVNFEFYECINGNYIVLKGNVYVSISPKRKDKCIEMLKHYLLLRRSRGGQSRA